MENSGVDKKGFWQTIPGMITGFAGFITAITGLIIALNQMGVFHKTEESDKIAGQNSSSKIVANNIAENNIQNKRNDYSDVKLSPDPEDSYHYDLIYKILSVSTQQKDSLTNYLTLKFRITKNGQGTAMLMDNICRLETDGILLGPFKTNILDVSGGSSAIFVQDNSSVEVVFQFQYPVSTKDFKVVFFRSNSRKEVPISVPQV